MVQNNSLKISWLEAVSVLTVSQIFSTVAYSAQSQNGLNATSSMIAFVLGTLLNFLVILPFVILSARRRKRSLLEHSYRYFGKLAVIVALAIFVVFIAVSVNTVVLFQKFLTNTVYQGSSTFVIISLLVLATSYGAFLGIEALGRVANIIFSLVSVSILLILLSVIKDFNLQNFGSVQLSDAKNIFAVAVKGVASNTGLLAAFMLLPSVNKNHFKGFCLWNLASLTIVEVIVATVSGVLGTYGLDKEYPYYTTATVAEISVLKRLDIIYLCIWIFVAFIKTTLYLLLSKKVLDTVLHKSAKKYSLAFCSVIVLLLSYIASAKDEFNSCVKFLVSSGWIFLILVILLPTVLLFIPSKQRGVQNADN